MFLLLQRLKSLNFYIAIIFNLLVSTWESPNLKTAAAGATCSEITPAICRALLYIGLPLLRLKCACESCSLQHPPLNLVVSLPPPAIKGTPLCCRCCCCRCGPRSLFSFFSSSTSSSSSYPTSKQSSQRRESQKRPHEFS